MTITTARQHGSGSSKPSASWSTRHCPVHCLDDRKFRSANPIPGPPAGFILDNRFFREPSGKAGPRSHASFIRVPTTIHTRVLQGFGFRYAHMLGTNADPNQPGRNATQSGQNPEELEKQRWFRPPLAFENAANDPPLDGELQPLCKADREGAAVLDSPQIIVP